MGSGACSYGFIIFLCLLGTGLVGLGLLGGGIGVYVTRNDEYNDEKNAVVKATKVWQDYGDPNSLYAFQLSGYVSFRPTVGDCSNRTSILGTSNCGFDNYKEQQSRFQNVEQKKYCVQVSYSEMQRCSYKPEIYLNKPGSSNPYFLAAIPSLVTQEAAYVEISMREIDGPYGCDEHASCDSCKKNCQLGFGGSFSCSSKKCRAQVYAADLGVKVNNLGVSFELDYTHPDMGPNSYAANVLPKGYQWSTYNVQSGDAPRWQYQKLAFGPNPPVSLTITVRSSYDPWLTYLAETDGSMYFADTEQNKILGITLLVIGSVITFCVLVFSVYLLYSRAVYKRSPDSRPSGGLAGMAWNMGRGIFSPPPRQSQSQLQPVAVTYAAPVYPPGTAAPHPGAPYAAAPYPGAYPAAPYPPSAAPGAYPAAYPPPPAVAPYPYYPVAPQQQQPAAGPSNGQQPQPQPQQQAPAAAGTQPNGAAGVAPAEAQRT